MGIQRSSDIGQDGSDSVLFNYLATVFVFCYFVQIESNLVSTLKPHKIKGKQETYQLSRTKGGEG